MIFEKIIPNASTQSLVQVTVRRHVIAKLCRRTSAHTSGMLLLLERFFPELLRVTIVFWFFMDDDGLAIIWSSEGTQ